MTALKKLTQWYRKATRKTPAINNATDLFKKMDAAGLIHYEQVTMDQHKIKLDALMCQNNESYKSFLFELMHDGVKTEDDVIKFSLINMYWMHTDQRIRLINVLNQADPDWLQQHFKDGARFLNNYSKTGALGYFDPRYDHTGEGA